MTTRDRTCPASLSLAAAALAGRAPFAATAAGYDIHRKPIIRLPGGFQSAWDDTSDHM